MGGGIVNLRSVFALAVRSGGASGAYQHGLRALWAR